MAMWSPWPLPEGIKSVEVPREPLTQLSLLERRVRSILNSGLRRND